MTIPPQSTMKTLFSKRSLSVDLEFRRTRIIPRLEHPTRMLQLQSHGYSLFWQSLKLLALCVGWRFSCRCSGSVTDSVQLYLSIILVRSEVTAGFKQHLSNLKAEVESRGNDTNGLTNGWTNDEGAFLISSQVVLPASRSTYGALSLCRQASWQVMM